MSPSLPEMPTEVLKRVALYAIGDNEPGPPKEFYSLLLTSKSLLKLSTEEFHYHVLLAKFEMQSPLRRLGESVLKQQAMTELRQRFEMLKNMRSGSITDDSVTEVLWMAYTMLEDVGLGTKNLCQLTWANLPGFLDDYLRNRLYEGCEMNDGWPLLTASNSLAIALSWLCLNEVRKEMEIAREELMHILEPLVFAAFRYPIFNANENYLDVNRKSPRLSQSTHGSYPPDPLPQSVVTYFGKVKCEGRAPLAPLFASMIYFTRIERDAPMVPPHLRSDPHRTRAEGGIHRHEGPTLEDVMEFVNDCNTHFVQAGNCQIKRQHIALSLDSSDRSLYTLGLLTGRWKGSYILPFVDDYQSWLRASSVPVGFKTTGRLPFFFSLQEHYACEGEDVVPHDEAENGTLNAWLPQGCCLEEKKDGTEFFDDHGTFRNFYRTFQPGQDSHDIKTTDVIVTGETDRQHAAAWGAYSVIGRIRIDDGLIMLQRHSLNGYGTTLMRGYVMPCGNFVGRLKGVSTGFAPAGWEGVFVLCKSDV